LNWACKDFTVHALAIIFLNKIEFPLYKDGLKLADSTLTATCITKNLLEVKIHTLSSLIFAVGPSHVQVNR
jgi:hypothetical protein